MRRRWRQVTEDIPDYQTLMLPVLRVASEGEIKVSACIARLANEFKLTDDKKNELLPSGRQTKFANRVHWAKTYLNQGGLVEVTRRGYFKATQRGHDVLVSGVQRIDNEYLSQFQEFVDFRSKRHRDNGSGNDTDGGERKPSARSGREDQRAVLPDSTTPEERIDAAQEEITSEVRQELLARIMEASPAFFEQLVVDLMVGMGYGGSVADRGKALGQSGDGGIDGIISEDALGLDSIYLQAKRYRPGNSVGIEKVREFAGSLAERGAVKGVFVTTSGFVSSAWDYAQRIPQTVVLIDGERLTRLLVTYGIGVRTTRSIELKRLDLDYFEEAEEGS
jgi:restriction system protein